MTREVNPTILGSVSTFKSDDLSALEHLCMSPLHHEKNSITRMHSSRMRTARLLPVSPSMHLSWGVYLPGGTCPGRVYLPRGCTCLGVYLSRRCTCPEGCTYPGGWCAYPGVPAQGVYLLMGVGVYLPRYSPLSKE